MSVSDCLSESDARIAESLVEGSVEEIHVVRLSVKEVTERTVVVLGSMQIETGIFSFRTITKSLVWVVKAGYKSHSGMMCKVERLFVVVLNCSRDDPSQLCNV